MIAQGPMTQQEYRLLQEMDRVRVELQVVRARCMQSSESKGDVVDQANDILGKSTDLALCSRHEQKLLQLEQANTRLHAGQHGVCETCGTRIDPARLDAIPGTTLCVDCQRQREMQGRYYRNRAHREATAP